MVLLLFLSIDLFSADLSSSEELQRARNRGAALYENQDYDLALPEFERCVELASESAMDLINLGLAYYRTHDYEKSITALDKGRSIDSLYLQAPYVLGLIHKRDGRYDEAAAELERVVAGDPAEPSAYYALGVSYKKAGLDEKAIDAFRAVVRHNQDHPSAHYYLFTYAKAQGRKEEAKREMRIFSALQRSIPDKQRTEAHFEEGPYLAPILPPHQSFASTAGGAREIGFHDVTEERGLPQFEPFSLTRFSAYACVTELTPEFIIERILPNAGGAGVLDDLDGDGDIDVYLVMSQDTLSQVPNGLYMNNGRGRFKDVTASSGADGGTQPHFSVAVGDYDGDGQLDMYLLNSALNKLLRNQGDLNFVDVTDSAGKGLDGSARAAAFLDYDHDGDLDLHVLSYADRNCPIADSICQYSFDVITQNNVLFRNNGDSSLAINVDRLNTYYGPGRGMSVLFGDCDDDDDTDLLTVHIRKPLQLQLNERGGKFAPVRVVGDSAVHLACLEDVDNDGDLDIVAIGMSRATLFQNDGQANFSEAGMPSVAEVVKLNAASAIKAADFNNDGLMDLLMGHIDGGLSLFINDGEGRFTLLPGGLAVERHGHELVVSLDAGDIDGDGDLDVLGTFVGGAPFLLENRGGESANWLEVEPVGVRVSKQGIGAKLEIKTGLYYQRRDVTDWPVHIGLGDVNRVDVLRITWTNGIVQNMVDAPINQKYRVEEIVRTDASCPFLYTFDGESFNYVNDILGVAAMGVPFGDGVYHIPDPDEYVKIRGELLTEFDGRYQLRLAEELKETTYLDQVRLLVIDHPAEVEVYPNEHFSEPPFIEPGIHTVTNRRHPIRAIDQNQNDILPLITKTDNTYPSGFPMSAYDGLAERHWIECELGGLQPSDKLILYLTGWIYWSSSSVNVAVSQNGQVGFEAVSLSVPDENGNWVTIIDDIGLPNGKNSTIPVDLTNRFLCDDYRVRLVTNLVVYWDEIFFTLNEAVVEVAEQEAVLLVADLHYRGFSAMTSDSLGMESFDYGTINRYGDWRQQEGMYTAFGKVTELLDRTDDRYVVYGPGEEVSLEFDASTIAPLPAGWSRDYFFYAYGWIKDGDLNTIYSKTVTPLPFSGMESYPYDSTMMRRAVMVGQSMSEYLTRGPVETVGKLRR